jgi:hypothetical protein
MDGQDAGDGWLRSRAGNPPQGRPEPARSDGSDDRAEVLAGCREQCLAAGMDEPSASPVEMELLVKALWKWVPARWDALADTNSHA